MVRFYLVNAAWVFQNALMVFIYIKTQQLFYQREEVKWVYFNATTPNQSTEPE